MNVAVWFALRLPCTSIPLTALAAKGSVVVPSKTVMFGPETPIAAVSFAAPRFTSRNLCANTKISGWAERKTA